MQSTSSQCGSKKIVNSGFCVVGGVVQGIILMFPVNESVL